MKKSDKTIILEKPEKVVVVKKPKPKKKSGPKPRSGKIQYKPKEYNLYVIWRSLPPMMLRPAKGTIEEMAEKMGIDDPLLLDLLSIKTQTEFAKRYDININTLSAWNALINKRDALADIRIWAKLLTKNVVLSMYSNATMKGGTSFKDRENFLKVIEKWSDKLNLEHSVDTNLADILKSSLSKKKNDTRQPTGTTKPQ